jgi:glycosyltransferase involved in cell wall biosynthesis
MRILYVCNDLPYFNAHRQWLAAAARQAGAEVLLATGAVSTEAAAADPEVIALDVERHRFDLRSDAALARSVRGITARLRPDVVHLITIKPVLFGALGLLGEAYPRRIVATFPGLGRVFDPAQNSPKARLRRALVCKGLALGLAPERVRAVFETEADRARLLSFGVLDDRRALHVPGAGVDPVLYPHTPLPPGPFRVLFASRLLKTKGVMIVAEAAALLAAQGSNVEIVIAGAEQRIDPDALDPLQMAALHENPHLRFIGEVGGQGMATLIASCHAVVLPTTYQEGVPRILIEAAAMGRGLIVSNNPGCTALVNTPSAGIVLKDLTAAELASVIARLAVDGEAMQVLADGAYRRFIEGGFSTDYVRGATLALYEA